MTPCMQLVEISNFFTKPGHRQTYQNYEHPPQTSQNLYIQSNISVLEIGGLFLKKDYEEYLTRRPTFIIKCF